MDAAEGVAPSFVKRFSARCRRKNWVFRASRDLVGRREYQKSTALDEIFPQINFQLILTTLAAVPGRFVFRQFHVLGTRDLDYFFFMVRAMTFLATYPNARMQLITMYSLRNKNESKRI